MPTLILYFTEQKKSYLKYIWQQSNLLHSCYGWEHILVNGRCKECTVLQISSHVSTWSSLVQQIFVSYITNWNMRIHVFWDVILCYWVSSLWHLRGSSQAAYLSKQWEPFTQWHSVTSHKMWILNHTVVKTVNVRPYHGVKNVKLKLVVDHHFIYT